MNIQNIRKSPLVFVGVLFVFMAGFFFFNTVDAQSTNCVGSIGANVTTVNTNPATVQLNWDSTNCFNIEIQDSNGVPQLVGPAGVTNRTVTFSPPSVMTASFYLYGADCLGCGVKSIQGVTITYSPTVSNATLNVFITGNPSQTPTWSINPENKSGIGDGSVVVQPNSNGSVYTITPQTLSGCTVNVLNTDGSGSSLTLYPGNTKNYTVDYTCGILPTVTLSASPTSVTSGNSSTLTWTVTNATSCTASNGWSGAKSTAGGSQSTGALTTTTTYDITCSNASGSASDSVTVTVTANPPPPPIPTVTLSASPTSVTSGNSSTLTWSSTNATSCTASNGWSGAKSTSGGSQSTGVLTTTTAYDLTCTNSNGSANASATVTVTAAPPPIPTVTLSASPTSVTSGNSSTLTWSSTNATSCTASNGWSGAKATSGSQSTGALTTTTTYTLTCTGPGGSANASATVTVTAATATITVNTNNAGATWGGSFSGSGLTQTYTVTPSSSGTLYTLTAGGISGFTAVVTNSQGTGGTMTVFPGASETFTITYSASGPVPTVTISASPTSGTVNVVNPQLTWSATNAPTSCTASGDWSGSKATSGTNVSQGVLTSVKTYTYTLTCTNGSGTSAPASATVVVSNPTPFTFNLTPASGSVSVTSGSSVTNQINAALLSGTTESITFTSSGFPSGTTVSYANQGCQPNCAMTLQLTVPAGLPTSSYTVNVTGTSASASDSTSFTLQVNAPAVLTAVCSVAPTTAQVGQSVTWTASVSGGTGPYTYSWSGTDMPTAPAPSSNPYVISYATVGAKSGSVLVTDTSDGSTASCVSQSVQVNVKPVLIEF